MKPEELDELFRRGLADQQLPPRPQAWDSIQQRLRAPIGEEDELPAFLRKAPEPVATPAMTASRGGGGNMTISWHQRPMWRAAAVAVLAVGGLLAQHQLRQADSAAPTMAVAERPTPIPTPATPLPTRQPATQVAVAVAAPNATRPTASVPTPAPHYQEPTAAAVAAVTPALIRQHLLCEDHNCQQCDLIEQQLGPARFRNLRTEAAAELLARNGLKVVVDQPTGQGFALASAAARRPSSHPALPPSPVIEPKPAPHALPADVAPLADAVVEVKIVPEELPAETEMPVVVATENQDAISPNRRSLRPADVLRRATERLLERIDRADHLSDGRLTIDTRVAGRPVRKTISL